MDDDAHALEEYVRSLRRRVALAAFESSGGERGGGGGGGGGDGDVAAAVCAGIPADHFKTDNRF